MAMQQLIQAVQGQAASITATEGMYLLDFDMERMKLDAAASISSSMDRVRGFDAAAQCAFLDALKDVAHVFGNDANTLLVEKATALAQAQRTVRTKRGARRGCTLHADSLVSQYAARHTFSFELFHGARLGNLAAASDMQQECSALAQTYGGDFNAISFTDVLDACIVHAWTL